MYVHEDAARDNHCRFQEAYTKQRAAVNKTQMIWQHSVQTQPPQLSLCEMKPAQTDTTQSSPTAHFTHTQTALCNNRRRSLQNWGHVAASHVEQVEGKANRALKFSKLWRSENKHSSSKPSGGPFQNKPPITNEAKGTFL